MPIYEYECDKCGRREERIIMSEDYNSLPCSEKGCNGIRHKIMSAPADVRGKSDHAGKLELICPICFLFKIGKKKLDS